MLFSLNRFERKKNVGLAIEALQHIKQSLPAADFAKIRLVIAGGYDKRVRENCEYLEELRARCRKLGLSHAVHFPGDVQAQLLSSISDAQVQFLPSISEAQRNTLIRTALCLLYTPSDEHFGIVPIEAMYCGVPVVAVNSGGPRETVINNITGFLCDPDGASFGQAALRLIRKDADRSSMAAAAQKHVSSLFSMQVFADKLESVLFGLFPAE